MVVAPPLKRLRFEPRRRHGRTTLSARIARAPETARFIRRAAPALWKEISREYYRESSPSPSRPDPRQWPDEGLHATWLGHSTVLLKVNGFTILTDPVFSSRIGLKIGPMTLGIKRLVDVALDIDQLPPIDLILLSHAHMDHFDLPSLRRLESQRTQVITADRTTDLLRAGRYRGVQELRWNETVQTGPALVRAFEVAHWGARMRSDGYRGYNGYVVSVGNYRVLFGGDTAYTESFKQLRTAEPIHLAIMPIGAYDPWIRVHCNPEQAWSMANDAGAEYILPVHHQTFKLSNEAPEDPVTRLIAAAGTAASRICLQQIGAEFHLE